jgi:predicted glycosyltransferase
VAHGFRFALQMAGGMIRKSGDPTWPETCCTWQTLHEVSALMGNNTDIIFMATSRSGLGHIRRTASIALAVKARRPDLRIALFTNAAIAGLTDGDLAAFDQTVIVERAAMMEVANAHMAQVIVADTMAPDGISHSRAARVLILREMPQDRIERLALASDESWDIVLVPNPELHWQPIFRSGFSKSVSATGWIYRKAQRKVSPSREKPLLLIATGGGGTAETALELAGHASRILARCRTLCPRPFEAVQALGPRAPAEALIAGVDRAVDPGGDLNQHFADADAVISTAGYNSVLELAVATTPTLLIPIARALDDQAARAAVWGPKLGAAFVENGHEAAARFLANVLVAQSRRPEVDIGPSGAGLAAARLLELMR